MPTITITGDTTQEALEQVLYQGIGKYGRDFNVVISENLRFENQNKEVKEFVRLLKAYGLHQNKPISVLTFNSIFKQIFKDNIRL